MKDNIKLKPIARIMILLALAVSMNAGAQEASTDTAFCKGIGVDLEKATTDASDSKAVGKSAEGLANMFGQITSAALEKTAVCYAQKVDE